MKTQRFEKYFSMIVGLLLAIVMVACSPTQPEGAAQNETTEPTEVIEPTEPAVDTIENQLVGTMWELISIDGTAVDGSLTLDFSADTVHGSDGCNSFSGGYTIQNGALVFAQDGFIRTEMACLEDGVMEMAQQYLDALVTASAFTLDNDSLTLETDTGALVYAKANSAELIDTLWQLAGLNNGTGGIVHMGIDENITMLIDGTQISGSAGCNGYGGSITIDGNQLTIGELVSTLMLCADDDVNEREGEFLAALRTVTSYEIIRETLSLYAEDGTLVANFIEANETASEPTTLYVGAELVDCVGEGPRQCMLVKQDPNAEYEFFYDDIAGFEWEAGYEYELLVNISEVENPPADASSLRYELVEVVNKTAVEMSETPEITNINWSLVNTIVGGDAVVPAPDFANPNFTIDGTMVSGNSGCNRFNGTVTIDGNNITFGALATTRMACDAERMTLETTMLDIFANAATFTTDGKTLELQNADGLPIATFAAAEEKTLYVGAETVDCVGVAPQQCLLVKEDPNADYTFFYDSIAGFEWEAGYEYELLVSVTEVMEPLQDASSLQYKLVQIVNKTEVAMSENSLTDTVWQWVRFQDGADLNNIEVDNPASYTIQFMADGTYAIQADCNSGSGGYSVDGSSIVIQPGPMTLAACGAESLDSTFLSRLGDVVTFVFDDEGNLVLNLKVDAGNMIFVAVQ